MTDTAAIIERLRAAKPKRTLKQVPPGMVVSECYYSRTGYALWNAAPDGSPFSCTCQPWRKPKAALLARQAREGAGDA